MAEKFADKVGQIPPRYVGVAAQIALGTSTLLTTPTPGTTFAFVDSQLHIPASVIGIIFIATGVIAGITESKWVYWIAGVGFFVLFSIVAFIGATNGMVSYQGGILYLALAGYALLTFPQGNHS